MQMGQEKGQLGQALNNAKLSAQHILSLVLIAFAFFAEGFDIQVLPLAIPEMSHDWGVTPDKFAGAASMGLVGFAIGAAIAGKLGDMFGRRICIILSVLLFGIGAALCGLAHDITSLTLLRIIIGIGLGGTIPNGTALISEIMPEKFKTIALGLCFAVLGFGASVSGVMGGILLPILHWQKWFMVAGLIGVVCSFALFLLLPESPFFLAKSPKTHEKLQKILKGLGIDNVELVQENTETQKIDANAIFKDASLRNPLIILSISSFCLYLAFFSIFAWGPVVFSSAGFDIAKVGNIFATFALGTTIGSILSGFIVRYLGTRVSFILCALALIIPAVFISSHFTGIAKILPILPSIMFVAGMGVQGFQTVLYSVCQHIFSVEMRATGMGITTSIGRVGSIASAYIGIYAFQTGGGAGFFIFIATAMLLAFILAQIVKQQVKALKSS